MAKIDANPMNPVQRLRMSPRCTARAKSSGERCQCPAVRGWTVCRLHGAGGGAEAGAEHPNFRHGLRSREVKLVRAMARALTAGGG